MNTVRELKHVSRYYVSLEMVCDRLMMAFSPKNKPL